MGISYPLEVRAHPAQIELWKADACLHESFEYYLGPGNHNSNGDSDAGGNSSTNEAEAEGRMCEEKIQEFRDKFEELLGNGSGSVFAVRLSRFVVIVECHILLSYQGLFCFDFYAQISHSLLTVVPLPSFIFSICCSFTDIL